MRCKLVLGNYRFLTNDARNDDGSVIPKAIAEESITFKGLTNNVLKNSLWIFTEKL